MIRGTMAMVVGRLGPSWELLTCFAGAGKPEPVGQSEARDRKLSLSFPPTETVLVLYLGRIGHKIPLNKNKIRRFSLKDAIKYPNVQSPILFLRGNGGVARQRETVVTR